MPDSFVHLHVHTEYSMLDGAAKLAELFGAVTQMEMPAVAVTDHGNMFGASDFYQEALRASVKPILGIEAYVAPESRFEKKPIFWGSGQRDENGESGDVSGGGAFTHMTMIAENATGVRNLFALSSLASMEGQYRKPRMDRELIAGRPEGIIGTTGCLGGEVPTRLRLGQFDEALECAAFYRSVLGPENYYVEVMDHGMALERRVREDLLNIARKLQIPVVATNDSHYVTADQATAHAALLCVQTGKTLSDPARMKFDGEGYYLKSAEEMRSYWDAEVPGACDATLEIAERVQSYSEVFEYHDRMPVFEVPISALQEAARREVGARPVDKPGDVFGSTRPLVVRVEAAGALPSLRYALELNSGTTPVCLVLCEDDAETTMLADFSVELSAGLLRDLHGLHGVGVA